MLAPVFSFAVVILRSCCLCTRANGAIEIVGDTFELIRAVRKRCSVEEDILDESEIVIKIDGTQKVLSYACIDSTEAPKYQRQLFSVQTEAPRSIVIIIINDVNKSTCP